LSYQGKASYLYASGITHDEKLTFIPPAQFENALTYSWPKAGRWKDLYVTVSVPTALKQYRAPKTVYPEDAPNYAGDETFDFMPAPKAYTLLNLEVGTKIPVGDKELSVILSGENLLNTSYRNYMNRLRYYADDTGRNIMLRLKYNFHSHKDL
jgi:iron complex outermembrane receptor protein